MITPKRIQRKRAKGWKMPEGTVYVDRPTKWGNPFGVHPEDGGKPAAARLFALWIQGEFPNTETDRRQWILDNLHKLAGKDLACWCPVGQCCHADVLLKMANNQIT